MASTIKRQREAVRNSGYARSLAFLASCNAAAANWPPPRRCGWPVLVSGANQRGVDGQLAAIVE